MNQTESKVILIIDDDAMNREVMEAFLTSEDFAVLLAKNGQEGFASARENIPHGIILDVRMPDMSGYEVCKQLKAEQTTQHIPVMIVTGFDAKEDFERGREAGADDFLTRPFDGGELLERVANLVAD